MVVRVHVSHLSYPHIHSIQGRANILRIHTKSMSVERDIRYDLIARMCPNATGAELRSVCTEAGMYAIRARRKVWCDGLDIALLHGGHLF